MQTGHTSKTYAGSGASGGASHRSPTAAVNWWLSDPPHRAVLLDPSWMRAGIGLAAGSPFNPPDPDPSGTFVIDFGRCTI